VRAVDTRGGRAANPAKSLHKSRHDIPSISVRSVLNLAVCVCEHSGSLVREKRYLSAYQLRCPVPRGPQQRRRPDPRGPGAIKNAVRAGGRRPRRTGLTPDTYYNSVRLITTVSRHRIYHRSDPRHSQLSHRIPPGIPWRMGTRLRLASPRDHCGLILSRTTDYFVNSQGAWD